MAMLTAPTVMVSSMATFRFRFPCLPGLEGAACVLVCVVLAS